MCAVDYLINHLGRRGTVVRNLSSSRASDDVVNKVTGCQVLATPVGEVHVARAMLACHNVVVGGEGNGGVLLPELHLGRDAPLAAALALCWLATKNTDPSIPVISSALFRTLPQYHIVKLKGPLPPYFDRCVEAVAQQFQAAGSCSLSRADGVRIDSERGWVHLRKSNTEPIFRVIGEYGNSEADSRTHCQHVLDQVAALSALYVQQEKESK